MSLAKFNPSQPVFLASSCIPPLSPKAPSLDDTDISPRVPIMQHHFPIRRDDNIPNRRADCCSHNDIPLVPISGQGILSAHGIEDCRNNESPELKMRVVDSANYVKTEGEIVDEAVDSLMNLDHGDALNPSAGKVGNIKMKMPPQHCRSLSMDSAVLEGFCLSSDNSVLGKLNSEFGHIEFTDFELIKIMADGRLSAIAVSDPKRAKRILANRQSAARSKERKTRYISELEHKVQTLQAKATTLSAQVTIIQNESAELACRNSELRIRVQAMEQQAQIRDALHEALSAEVDHLKIREEEKRRTSPNGIGQQATANLKPSLSSHSASA